MWLTICESSLIHCAVCIFFFSFSIWFIIFKLSFINITVRIMHHTISVPQTVFVSTFIFPAGVINHCAFSVWVSILIKLTFIYKCIIGPNFFAIFNIAITIIAIYKIALLNSSVSFNSSTGSTNQFIIFKFSIHHSTSSTS